MRWLILILAMFALPATAGETIVVTGKREQEQRELKARATAFVRQAASIAPEGQYARRSSYCPRVFGLPQAYVPVVLARIADAGRAAGLADPPRGCRPDLAVIFTEDADALMSRLARSGRMFMSVTPAKERELFGSGRAVRWWYGEVMGGADGASQAEHTIIRHGAGTLEVQQLPVWTSSLIGTNVTMSLTGSIVVIDVNKAAGFPLDAMAAYAAMVSFIKVDGGRTFDEMTTVLALPSATVRAAVPRTLTAWDRAYLKALYLLPRNREAWTQRAALAAALVNAGNE